MIMNKKLLSILALLCLTVTSAWATNYTSFSGGEVLKPGDTFTVPSGDEYWDINDMVFNASCSPFTVLRAYVFPGDEPEDPATVSENADGMFYVIKDKNGAYYFADTEKMNLLPAMDNNTATPYDGIAVTKTGDKQFTFAEYTAPPATSGYCGDPDVNNGENVTWKVSGTTITISGMGAMADYDDDTNMAPWLDNNIKSYAEEITAIVIESGVTTVGSYAFKGCYFVTSISIPTSVTTIGSYAFEDCNYVTSISIPAGVTTIGSHAFENCYNAESISIPASVTSIGEKAFYHCGQSTHPTVTIADGSNLETIGNSAFENCPMASFSIPDGVKTIGASAFRYCSGLTSMNIPASVTSIGENAFQYSLSLKTVTLNGNPYMHASAFNNIANNATVTMNLTATVGESGDYWLTFYNENHSFQVPTTGTQIFKAAPRGSNLLLRELSEDRVVTKNNAVILKSETASISLTRTTASSSNFTGNGLQGVKAVAGATSDGTFYALNSDAQGVGFYPVASGTKVALGNAYVTSDSSSDFLAFVIANDVTFADGLTDWTATPAPAAEGETVTLNYSGKKKVKSITVTNY